MTTRVANPTVRDVADVADAADVAAVAAGLGTILGVWAHPDDEAYLSGGLMAAGVEAGARVVCVTATRGERGTPDPEAWPPARLAATRDVELAGSLAVLGVTEHRQLDYPDGGCALVPTDEAVRRLHELIEEVRPDTVLTFGPDGITGHADHRVVSAWATAAVGASRRRSGGDGPRLLYAARTDAWCGRFDPLNRSLWPLAADVPRGFAADEVAFEVTLTEGLLDRKVAALMAQATQVEPLIEAMGADTFRAWVAEECFREARSGVRG